MREIRFRAWYSGFMYYNVTRADFDADGVKKVQLNHSLDDWDTCGDTWAERDEEDFILMQYTGLKDRNGKEIYEGDIVISHRVTGSGKRIKFGPREVRWDDDLCEFNVSTPTEGGELEVIGNIYENPELLERP